MNQLTRAEEEVMQVLWDLGHAFVKEVLEQFPEPKPAYNTLSTIVRILETKGFVGHEAMGRSHRYHPIITREAYRKASLSKLAESYFEGSFEQLASCWMEEKGLTLNDIEAIKAMLNKKSK
ncbi:MAG: BlaI/MecI/CopY family transcriptional regulator [Flavobacteriales bacterium]|nr:BlaI/MecI/CopY family transcriptional regulator [Flavobacteriales bacterium]MDG1781249.1 BlaI/MecI/CopY family transcriptional regulator [Flavobacteriales bacterium]MDG2244940.1 BlaI/MecI/CopY family transcriptional regulator [Flavobacteriales bacterium]